MRLLFLPLLMIGCLQAMAQCKTFKISSKGDTLNCTDQRDMKRGKWAVHVEPLRGNPGYDEEGEFVDDRKTGIWRKYNALGDLLAVQNYKWGNLDSISTYYTLAGMEREESWRAMNPDKAYDTLDVQDVNNQDKYVSVVVKNEGKAMKHGTWKWYRPGSMSIVRSEVYVLNKIQIPNEKTDAGVNSSDSSSTVKKPEPKKAKPKEVEQFEKKNSGKKSTKVRDGKTG